MTAVLPISAPPSVIADASSSGYLAGFQWSWRLMRRGAVLMWITVAIYMTVEVLVFRGAYPDAASRQKLLDLSTSNAVRMLQGVVETGPATHRLCHQPHLAQSELIDQRTEVSSESGGAGGCR